MTEPDARARKHLKPGVSLRIEAAEVWGISNGMKTAPTFQAGRQLADVALYLLQLASVCIDLENAIIEKLKVNAAWNVSNP